jgi:hypothetical protein
MNHNQYFRIPGKQENRERAFSSSRMAVEFTIPSGEGNYFIRPADENLRIEFQDHNPFPFVMQIYHPFFCTTT